MINSIIRFSLILFSLVAVDTHLTLLLYASVFWDQRATCVTFWRTTLSSFPTSHKTIRVLFAFSSFLQVCTTTFFYDLPRWFDTAFI